MPEIGIFSRDSIVRLLTEALRPLPYVHAFWEAGAAALNRVDEWSDIDLYIVVDDAEAVSETFQIVEKALTDLSAICLKHEVSWSPTSEIYQKLYRLSGTSEFLLVDLAVMTLSRPGNFLATGRATRVRQGFGWPRGEVPTGHRVVPRGDRRGRREAGSAIDPRIVRSGDSGNEHPARE